MNFSIRFAQNADCGLILQFIKELAAYEKMSDMVVATEDILRETLFVKQNAEVIIGELDGKAIAFALFFSNYSTFLGRANMYLEDIFVKEEYRKQGVGKLMFAKLASIAVERGCKRLDWQCLDWNTPSIRFYEKLGAVAIDEWITYRLQGAALLDLAR